MMDMPTCQELTELVTDYLENRMPPDVAASFEQHMAACPLCANYLNQMKATVDALGHLPKEPIPEAVMKAFASAFREWKKKDPGT